MPAFRDRFSGEALRAGVALRVARTAILFSDLTGSTALYRRAGDAVAFRVITDHFALLSHHIEQAGGVVIKTIGDAVMAAFSDDEAAVRAASALLVAYPRFRSATPDAATTDLKLGIHAGSCYAVTANGVLDYFGQTVNLAARLQALAHAGELILPAPTWATAAAEHWADGLALAETLSVVLKGLEEPTPAVRLRRAA